MPNEPGERMLIGELSQRTGASPRMLRHYGHQGLLEDKRTAAGHREYSTEAVLVVSHIRTLIHAGLTTEKIRSLLPCIHGPAPTVELCNETDELLSTELHNVEHNIKRLTQQRDTLAGLLAP